MSARRALCQRCAPPASRQGDREVVLQAVDVSREFGGVRAVAGVSFTVRRGTLTGLIGPNGAGKSTLLAMLAGTLPVSGGQIHYQGQDVTGLPAYRRARLGLVRTFQLASEFKRLTVMENLLTAVPDNRGDSFRGALAGPQVLARRRGRRDRQGRGAAGAVRPRRATPTATPGTSAAASAGWWRSCAR